MFKEFLQKIKDFFNRIFSKNKLMLKEAENQSNIEVGPIVEKNTEEKAQSIVEEKATEKTPNIVEKLKEEIEAIDQKIASITETIRKMDEQLAATGTEN